MQVPRYGLLATGALATALSFAGSADALSVHVQHKLAIRQNVHVTFRAHKLPQHGYYYAVIVLKAYMGYTQTSPPPCSTSSNMFGTNYGYPQEGEVALTLTPAKSPTRHWCRRGSYEGGVYAVPHAPPCESTYPCRSEPYTRQLCLHPGPGSGCVLGVIIRPGEYVYPDRLPRPVAKGASIVGRFTVTFP